MRTSLSAFVAVFVAGALVAPASFGEPVSAGNQGPRYTAGASGAGDPYFAFSGNGGYDVTHYDLQITYTPPAAAPAPLVGQLDGVATITLDATQDLDRFNLDLRGMAVSAITINGKTARAIAPPAPGVVVDGAAYWHVQDPTQRLWELTVQPRPKLKAGQQAEIVIAYGGATGRPRDIEGALYGWVTTRDGAMVVNEPEGAMTWYPVSDHPTDKATYTFDISVPEGKTAVANGVLAAEPVTNGGWTTWLWDAPDQQASYLSTASVGDFERIPTGASSSGVPIYDFIDTNLTPARRATSLSSLALQPAMIDLFESLYGDYPFNSFGSIVDDDTVGYALETQTRPVYSSQASEGTVAHELAHMWFGDSVSPERWADIWLNEGWATYLTVQWRESRGTGTTQEFFDDIMSIPADDEFWLSSVADPGPLGLFLDPVYDRGAATLHALRLKIGDPAFYAGARMWLSRFGDGTASTADFEAVFEETSEQDLTTFFQVWVHNPVKPASW
jgi:aminopeptidase N